MEGYFLAEVRAFAGNFAPRNWIDCKGQLLPISQNTAVFSLVGTIYGGDGRTTFGVPDLQGRVPMGATNTMGRGPGLSDVRQGAKGGAEAITLSNTQIPSHTHTSNAHIAFSGNPATINSAAGNQWSLGINIYSTATVSDVPMAENSVEIESVSSSGGSQSHENMNPFIAMKYIMCLQGLYPSRS